MKPSASLFRISSALLEQILFYCSSERPHEACGFLFGIREQEHLYEVTQFVPVRNIHPEPKTHFEMDPLETVRSLSTPAPSALIGVLHSHPTAAAIPSENDMNTEWYTVPSHWIVSLAQDSCPVVEAFGYFRVNKITYYSRHSIQVREADEQQKNPQDADVCT